MRIMRVAAVCLTLASTADAAARPRVLILFSNDRLLPANQQTEHGIRRAFEGADGNATADLFGEFLDAVRFPEPDLSTAMERFLRDRHHDTPPSVCIALGPQAMDFMIKRRESLFPGIPLVLGAVTPPQMDALDSRQGVAGRPMEWSIAPLLENLPQIKPEIRRILLVSGASDFDHKRHDEALAQVGLFTGRYGFESSRGEPLDQLLERTARLAGDTLVFYISYFSDPDGRTFTPQEVAGRLAKASSVPVACVFDTYLGTGVIGGPMMPFEEEGHAIGKITRQVLESGTAGTIGILPPGKPRLIFDHRAMKRHGWSVNRMPPNTEIRHRPPGLWAAHRGAVIAGTGAITLQSALIIGLIAFRSRQRRAEKERILSESRFSGVFHGSPVSISIIRQTNGRIVDVNPAWESTTGVPRAHAIGRTHTEMGFGFEGSSDGKFRDYLASGKALRDFEQRLRMPDGNVRLLSVSTELVELHGEPCYISMAKDITDAQQAEEALRKLAHASRIGMLGELTATIAHEVNQPLGAILSNADAATMLLDSPGPPLDEIREILTDIRRDDMRASEVIRQVRALASKGECNMTPLDPGELAAGVASLVRKECKRRGISLECDISARLPRVHGEKVRLEQVLLNLLLNAMESLAGCASLHKSIHITVETTAGDMTAISVSDNGPGIPPDIMPHIFGNFFTTKPEGMGLGLALSRSIVESHGGRLLAENTPHGGACFRVLLPPCHEG